MGERKHFLDWLRVIAFGLLIAFHTGLLYGPWSYNLKSPRPVDGLEWLLEALTPWRMALIFMISGVASAHLLAKLGPGRFAADRLRRLAPVILFGMFVVIPPQTWIELFDKGVTRLDYWRFWTTEYLVADQTLVAPLGKTMPTWDHLWFLVYLLAYALALAALARLVRMRLRPPLSVLLVGPALWMGLSNVVIDRFAPVTHAFADDWGAHLKWSGVFGAGVLLASRHEAWAFLRRRAAVLVMVAAALLAGFLAARGLWLAMPAAGPAFAFRFTEGLYGWSAVLAVSGWAARRLDRPSAALAYLNEAVLPVYVLHQPILLFAAHTAFPWRLPLGFEALLLAAATAIGSIGAYHLAIRPFGPMRFVFGMKPRPAQAGARAGGATVAP